MDSVKTPQLVDGFKYQNNDGAYNQDQQWKYEVAGSTLHLQHPGNTIPSGGVLCLTQTPGGPGGVEVVESGYPQCHSMSHQGSFAWVAWDV